MARKDKQARAEYTKEYRAQEEHRQRKNELEKIRGQSDAEKKKAHEYYLAHKEKFIEKSNNYYRNRTPEQVERDRVSHQKRYIETREQRQAVNKAWLLKNKYGISVEDYNALLERQGGGCAICGKPDSRRSLSVDHDHDTGEVRGLLCHNCNVSLGLVNDDTNILQAMIDYLRKVLTN